MEPITTQTLLFNNKTIDDSNSNLKELTAEQLEILDGPVDILFRTLQEVDPIIAKNSILKIIEITSSFGNILYKR